METLSELWPMKGVRLPERGPGEPTGQGTRFGWVPLAGGWRGGQEGRGPDASTGFLPRTAGLVWKTVLGKSRVGSESYSHSSNLTDGFPTKERTANAFLSLYFKLSAFHASFDLKCVFCFLMFQNSLFPYWSLNLLPTVPQQMCAAAAGAALSTINCPFLFSSLPPVSASDGWAFRVLEAWVPYP